MKEVPFRWIDQYLIKLSIAEKFAVVLWLPIITVLVTNCFGLYARDAQLLELQTNAAQQQLTLAASLWSEQNISQLPSHIRFAEQLPANQADLLSVRLESGGVLLVEAPKHAQHFLIRNFLPLLQLSLVVVLIGVAYHYLTSFVSGALYSLNRALEALAGGDLTFRLNFFPVRDEFSTLAINLDKNSERQHQLATTVEQTASGLISSATQFEDGANRGSELAASQHTQLESLAAAIEQMTVAVAEVANSASEALHRSESSKQQSDAGVNLVAQTTAAIQTLSDDVASAADAVEKLSQNALQIGAVVDVINSISEQTNLLALNAAIEAARAGEMGRGFAVVADEVRSLAGRTQQATVEIQTMITELQADSDGLKQVVEQTVSSAGQSCNAVTDVGNVIQAMSVNNTQVLDMATLIATSAEQQSQVAQEVSEQVDAIRGHSEQLASTSSSVQQQSGQLKQRAETLHQVVAGLTLS